MVDISPSLIGPFIYFSLAAMLIGICAMVLGIMSYIKSNQTSVSLQNSLDTMTVRTLNVKSQLQVGDYTANSTEDLVPCGSGMCLTWS